MIAKTSFVQTFTYTKKEFLEMLGVSFKESDELDVWGEWDEDDKPRGVVVRVTRELSDIPNEPPE